MKKLLYLILLLSTIILAQSIKDLNLDDIFGDQVNVEELKELQSKIKIYAILHKKNKKYALISFNRKSIIIEEKQNIFIPLESENTLKENFLVYEITDKEVTLQHKKTKEIIRIL